MKNKLNTLIKYTTNLLLYWISFIVPKNKKIWIFGSWGGHRYADNSRYLFEYIKKNTDIRGIWITKDKIILKKLQNEGFEVYLAYSMKAIYYSMRAKVLFVTQAISGDLHYFNIHPSIYKVQLWHGAPLKKILHDSHFAQTKLKYQSRRKMINILFPFYEEKYNLLTACSEEDKKSFSSAFLIKEEKIKILGYPRNDILANSHLNNKSKKILYAPTLRRDNENKVLDIFSIKEIEHIESSLLKTNSKLYVKLHPLNIPNKKLIENMKKTKSIILLSNDVDLQEELKYYDILITDYSSIYFDFLLTGRPIIFAPFDHAEYIINDRTFYYDYNEVTPGPKIKNWNEALIWINKFSDCPDLYLNERIKITNRFHFYQDFHSSKRIVEYVVKAL